MKSQDLHVWTVWHPQPAGISDPKTFRVHKNIQDKFKEVYWGVITDRPYPNGHPFDNEIEIVNKQLADGIKTLLFVDPRDHQEMPIRGEIKKVIVDLPEWKSLKTIPDYYREITIEGSSYKIPYWFLLSTIEQIDHKIIHQIEILSQFDSSKHGSFGYHYPGLCKFHSEKETITRATLQWKDITITFINSETVGIEIKGVQLPKKYYTFDELNFNDKRCKHSNKKVVAWEVLLFTAVDDGSISFRRAFEQWKANGDNFKKMIDKTQDRLNDGLLQILSDSYRIEGQAFEYQKKNACYRALFSVRISSDFYENVCRNGERDFLNNTNKFTKAEQGKHSYSERHYADNELDKDYDESDADDDHHNPLDSL